MMSLKRRFLAGATALTALLASAAPGFAAVDRTPGVWTILEGWTLHEDSPASGDHFRLALGDQVIELRLYFVDAPESTPDAERLPDQTRYFQTGPEPVLAAGAKAAAFARQWLRSDPFSVKTKWEDARQDAAPAYFAVLQRPNGETLAEALLAAGLARLYGPPPSEAWPGGPAPEAMLAILKARERGAQAARVGIWAAASASPQLAGLERLGPGGISLSGSAAMDRSARPLAERINLNTATAAELETLQGIGPSLAERIIEARPIDTIEALAEISGISTGMVAEFRPLVMTAPPPPDPMTARFYLADPEPYLNTDVRIRVTSIATVDSAAPEGFRALQLGTGVEGRPGGSILAFIPEEFFDAFLAHHATPGKVFRGFLYRQDEQIVLVYRRATHGRD